MSRLVRAIRRRLSRITQGKLQGKQNYLPYVTNKCGLEIGGPSELFRQRHLIDIYGSAASIDNCDFSQTTVWADQKEYFSFHPDKNPGKSIFCDGSALVSIGDGTYDFVLSCHNLEHFANPVKALKEWKRVLRPSGALILVLPYYKQTFDHRRSPTPVNHMLEDFDRNVGEDDLTHLAEILEKHDLSMDRAAGTKEQFHRRSLDNLSNRCLHHHVFNQSNSVDLLKQSGFNVHSVALVHPHHIYLLAAV